MFRKVLLTIVFGVLFSQTVLAADVQKMTAVARAAENGQPSIVTSEKEAKECLSFFNQRQSLVTKRASAQIKTTNGTMVLSFVLPENFSTQQSAAKAKINEIAASAQGSMDEKLAYFENYIIDNVSYNSNYVSGADEGAGVYDALFNGKAVCMGYAQLLYHLCRVSNIPCQYITGSYNGAFHAWNVVTVNGRQRIVDLTFADSTKDMSYLDTDMSDRIATSIY